MGIFQKRSPDNPLAALEPPPPEREPQPVSPSAPPPFLRDNEVRTSIGADAVINGKLAFTTPTRVEGKLKGELRCTQLLIIGSTAVVEGSVKADELRVEGLVRGEITETRKVEICPQGKLIGKVSSQLLIIRDGGFFEGECAVGPTSRVTIASLGAEVESASG
jgi:cytoskeletal protein CcmA (bactofilin family)